MNNIDRTKKEPWNYVLIGYSIFLIIGAVIVFFIGGEETFKIPGFGEVPSPLVSFIVGFLSPRLPFYKS
jgi:hypothetical protein